MIGLFVYYPLIRNFQFSFLDFDPFSPQRDFVGLANYTRLLEDEVVRVALLNNIKYAVISVICQVGIGLVLAAVLEDVAFRKLSPLFRTVFFLPVVISSSVVCLLFSFIYHPTNGLLNLFLEAVGLGSLAQPWLGQGSTAIYATIAVSQWHSIGYIMMLLLVAIQSVPEELYEAAEIDGASKMKKFFSITIPQIKEMLFVACIITVTGSMLVFNEPYILTKGGGPGTSSITMAVHMYQAGFKRDEMGYGSTIAVVIFVISAILAAIQMFGFKSGKEE